MNLKSIVQLVLVMLCMFMLVTCGQGSTRSYSLQTTTTEEASTSTLKPLASATPTLSTSILPPNPIPDTASELIIPSECKTDGRYISDQEEYLGPLIDAHVHLEIWGFTYPIESLVAKMDETGIVKIVVHDDSETAMSAYNRYPEKIVPFIRIGSPQKKDFLTKLKKELNSEKFYGIGEVSLRHWSRGVGLREGSGTSIESQRRQAGGGKGIDTPGDSLIMKEILDLAAKHDIPVAVHLDNFYSDELESLLEHNREGIVIWSHVGTTPMRMTDPKAVSQMMDKHPNLYADLSAVSPFMKRSSLLDLDGNLDEHWMTLFEMYSNRFFFGIDIFLEEHLALVPNEVVYWRNVLGQLRPETAIKIGCSNIAKITSMTNTDGK